MTRIDKVNQRIILELFKDGRRPYVEIAREMGVTEGTIRKRVKELLAGGIIRITAVPHLDRLGYDFIGIVGLQVGLHALRDVGRELAKHANVCYLANVTGRFEYIAIIAAKSSKEFASFMEDVVANIPDILRTETFVTLHIYKGAGFSLDTTQIIGNLDVLESGEG